MHEFLASDFFKMGGYASFVWTAYAVFFVVLIADAIAPVLQRRRTLRELRGRRRREQMRKSS